MGLLDRIDAWAEKPPFPAHRTTTRQLRAVQPMAATSLGPRGTWIGVNVNDGSSWCFDPWFLYGSKLRDPNILLLGSIGFGKSAFVKAWCYRSRVFGRRTVILSPKPDEYRALAEACGVTPIVLTPGGKLRLNPLDTVDVEDSLSAHAQRVSLLTRLCDTSLERRTTPEERGAIAVALEQAIRDVGDQQVTVRDVVYRMLEPTAEQSLSASASAGQLKRESRSAAKAMEELVTGSLAGMFDEPTSPEIDLTADCVILDLSSLRGIDARPMAMALTCITATLAGQLARASETGAKTILAIEEAWAVLRNPWTAAYFQAQTKLSRQLGLCNLFVLHKLADLQALGGADSEQVKIALNLVADCGTKIIYRQRPDELDRLTSVLQLSEMQREVVTDLGLGQALWMVGSSKTSARVHLQLSEWERTKLTHTDDAMQVTT